MKLAYFIISLVAYCQLVADELTSPNGQYKIEYDAKALEHESNVEIKNAKTGKVLIQTFSYGYYQEKYREIAWSPDSKYLAVITRGTRTSSDLEVFIFNGDTVKEVKMPHPKLSDKVASDKKWSGRYSFVKHLKWEGSTLKYYCFGDKVYGAGDVDLVPDNWYHFDITLGFGKTGKTATPQIISVSACEPKWRDKEPSAQPEAK